MRKVGGYAEVIDPIKGAIGNDTITCCHCNKKVDLKPERTDGCGVFCTTCGDIGCVECAKLPCDPFEAKLDRWEGTKLPGKFRCA